MIVLGVTGGHDAGLAVVRDGELIGAIEKERFTRRRHDGGDVMCLVRPALRACGLTPDDVDVVATSEPVHRGTDPGLRRLAGRTYRRPDGWEHQVVELLGRVLPCVSVAHHLAHAAYAMGTSDFDEAAVLTMDGGGDFYTEDAYCSTSVSMWRERRLDWLERVENSDLGSLWFMFARAVFGDGNHSGKLMGLAAYGSDRLVDAFAERFTVPVKGILDGVFTIKNCWPDYEWPPFVRGASWEDAVARDAAAAVQALTIRCGVGLARRLREVTGAERLCVCGGVALNGYLMTAIRRDAGFAEVFVPPAVHDGGLAAGAALFASGHVLGEVARGPSDRLLDRLGFAYGREAAIRAATERGLEATQVDREEAIETVAGAIAAGDIVGWYEGRSEHGPRALGARSILAHAVDAGMCDRLNAIKDRETFRPVAPVVTEERAARYFDLDFASPYMMFIVDGTPAAVREAPSALHVDGTARVQTVRKETSLGRLAERVGALTGVPVIINTSLNVRAPIAETPADALDVFQRVPLAMMQLDGVIVRRV